MLRGLQAGFNGVPLPPEWLADLRDRGVETIRFDCQTHGPEVAAARDAEVQAAGIRCLTIAHSAADAAGLPPGAWVEFRNEPDIGTGYDKIAPDVYRQMLGDFVASVEALELVIYAGAVSNFNERGLSWLQATQPSTWPAAVRVSAHWYPHGSAPDVPHPGFRSREHELEAFRQVIGDRPFLLSEFGYHTAPRRVGPSWLGKYRPVERWTDEQVADFVRWEWRFWEQAGAEAAYLYQLLDGTNDGDPYERYGIRRLDDTYKPVADTFKEGR